MKSVWALGRPLASASLVLMPAAPLLRFPFTPQHPSLCTSSLMLDLQPEHFPIGPARTRSASDDPCACHQSLALQEVLSHSLYLVSVAPSAHNTPGASRRLPVQSQPSLIKPRYPPMAPDIP